jgi:hypothetical protein
MDFETKLFGGICMAGAMLFGVGKLADIYKPVAKKKQQNAIFKICNNSSSIQYVGCVTGAIGCFGLAIKRVIEL